MYAGLDLKQCSRLCKDSGTSPEHTERELLKKLEVQEKLEKWEIGSIELARLRNDVSRLEQELEFTKRLNDQCRKHDKAMQDLKDIQCAEWKRVADEAQKQLQFAQTALLQVVMQNRADDTGRRCDLSRL